MMKKKRAANKVVKQRERKASQVQSSREEELRSTPSLENSNFGGLEEVNAIHEIIGRAVVDLNSQAINHEILSLIKSKYGQEISENVSKFFKSRGKPSLICEVSSPKSKHSTNTGTWEDSLALVKENILEK